MRLWSLFLIGALVLAVLLVKDGWLLVRVADSLGFSSKVSERAGAEEDAWANSTEDFPKPNRSAKYWAASKALRDGEYSVALAELESCSPDDSGCLGLKAEAYLSGAGVTRNLTEAMRLFHASADFGDSDSQYALGVLYSNAFEGDPAELRRSEALGVLHLYAASIAGHPGALMAMGYRHAQGYGVPKMCNTAALNYIEVARRVAQVYSAGMPQAVELIRLGVEGRDQKAMTASAVSIFVEIAASGDASIAAAVGKRYLLGIDGFRQSYKKAAQYLEIAAEKGHGGALALLGYMYCLGLGVEKSLDVAYSYFTASAGQEDAVGHNGLGYIFFHGTQVQSRNLDAAFRHFNASAHGGSADGMFNLASLYLTGTGTEKSFQRAALWYTQALDRGHTPAAYALAVMHLNGVGTIRNCKIAVDLLKRVCERGGWVSQKLQEAYDYKETRPDAAAWLFLRLAEAGHEVAQMNLAHLLDTGSSFLLADNSSTSEPSEEVRMVAKVHAQRHYEMSAEQGNALSELRLGDYAYYGWGLRAGGDEDDDADLDLPDEEVLAKAEELHYVRQEADVTLSFAHYKRAAEMRITSEWMQPFVARASFNLGMMHQFGIGVDASAPLARRYYNRCLEADPTGVQAPVTLMLAVLAAQALMSRMPATQVIVDSLLNDLRTHMVAVNLVALGVFLGIRAYFARTPAAAGPVAAETGEPSSSQAEAGDTTIPTEMTSTLTESESESAVETLRRREPLQTSEDTGVEL